MSASTQTSGNPALLRWSVIVAIAIVAFFGSYRFAVAASATKQAAGGTALAASPLDGSALPVADPNAAGGSACGCCGGGAPAGEATVGQAEVSGDVQKITVDLSKGYYDPSVIELKAGVPAEITFGQSGGCTAQVQSQELGFYEDLTSGPKTIKLDGLTAGTYSFTCGMNMVSGSIVVK